MTNNQIRTSVQHKILDKEGYNIHYFLSGDKNKETILFIHPAFSDHTCFNKQIDFFAQQYHVMTIDLLGHGLSKVGKSNDKIDKSVEHINDILHEEGIDSVHVVGVSMGSLIAQYFAIQYPEKILSLTALGGFNINHKNKELDKAQRKEMFNWLFKVIFSMDAFRRYAGSISAINKSEQTHFYESTKGFSRKSFTVMSALSKVIEERENSKRDYPLLILTGNEDNDLAKKVASQWHEEESISHFYIIENAGHCANMDNSERFNEIVSNVINEKQFTNK